MYEKVFLLILLKNMYRKFSVNQPHRLDIYIPYKQKLWLYNIDKSSSVPPPRKKILAMVPWHIAV